MNAPKPQKACPLGNVMYLMVWGILKRNFWTRRRTTYSHVKSLRQIGSGCAGLDSALLQEGLYVTVGTKTDFVVLRNRCSFVTITAVLVLRKLTLLCYETDVVLLRQTESEHIPILDKLAKNSKKCLRTIVFAYVFRLGDVGATFHVLWC